MRTKFQIFQLRKRALSTVSVFMLLFLASCTMNKRIYISNKTDQALTLSVRDILTVEPESMLAAFRDSLDGKHMEPGNNIKISFGKGKWKASDEESLKKVLQHLHIKKEGNDETYKLPKDIPIGHGLLIPELIVRINELE